MSLHSYGRTIIAICLVIIAACQGIHPLRQLVIDSQEGSDAAAESVQRVVSTTGFPYALTGANIGKSAYVDPQLTLGRLVGLYCTSSHVPCARPAVLASIYVVGANQVVINVEQDGASGPELRGQPLQLYDQLFVALQNRFGAAQVTQRAAPYH
jgi:hypothetical protein